jgi:hypothetical protein
VRRVVAFALAYLMAPLSEPPRPRATAWPRPHRDAAGPARFPPPRARVGLSSDGDAARRRG